MNDFYTAYLHNVYIFDQKNLSYRHDVSVIELNLNPQCSCGGIALAIKSLLYPSVSSKLAPLNPSAKMNCAYTFCIHFI